MSSQISKRDFLAVLLGHYRFGGRKGEREVDYFRGLMRETVKKEFSFRGIESKIVRRHPR